MSKPPFSRKRKGKKVDPYPLGSTRKGKSSQTKGSRGRPRKAQDYPLEMSDDRFWSLIKEAGENPDKLERLLGKESDENIFRFQTIWNEKVGALHEVGAVDTLIKQEGGVFDSIDYMTFGVVASGREFYNMVMRRPTDFNVDENEAFDYAAAMAWENRHGEDQDFYDAMEVWEKAQPKTVTCGYCGATHRVGSSIQKEHAMYAAMGQTQHKTGPKRKAGEYRKDVLEIVQDSDPMTVTAIARKASERYPYRDPGGTGMYMWTIEQLEPLVAEGKVGIYFGKSGPQMQKVRYGRPNDTELVRSPSGRLIVLKGYVGKYTIGRSPIPSQGGKPYFAWPEGAGTRRDWDKIGRGRSPDEALADAKQGSR